eukprot:TRINITY_DN488_c0_g1_i2.p1 TRINITY_DN488_c0_g1~~TRINITY_DN488_c0_g1_i2.p1  ORF type:complete len:176 (+),score=36.80 TRINITY_DN488_c0_g1_i2:219-746(+)
MRACTAEMAALNPMEQIPTLLVDGRPIAQSVAIMEYLNDVYPEPALLPRDPFQRAQARQVVELIVSGIQPLQNLSVLNRLKEQHGEAAGLPWAQHWINKGFASLEKLLEQTSGKYCVGDELSLADCVLPPQVYNAVRFSVDLTPYPTVQRVHAGLVELPAFQKAHPDVMPDAPKQ